MSRCRHRRAAASAKPDNVRPPYPGNFITVFPDEHRRERALKAGAVDYLPKPVEPERLLDAIRVALTRGDPESLTRPIQRHPQGDPKEDVKMQKRFEYTKAYPDAHKAMLGLSGAVVKTGLPVQLIDLVNYPVSQLNGCAFCLDMHSKDLRDRGETEQRLYMVSA